uniref:Oral-facial-digital syndrome 1 n=1 Tax=Nothobranchius korthausae TaxID=1143690 RepID=A0A1A8GCV1_9TELE
MEDTYDQKLKNELSRYQLELKEEFIKRTESLTESENRNKEEAARIQKESAVINAALAEHDKARSELKRRQIELETAEQQISLLTQQNNVLKERLESTGDYLSLKRERAELQGQVELLKQQLEGAQEESRRLRAEIIRPSEAQLALQKELQRLQNARRVDEEDSISVQHPFLFPLRLNRRKQDSHVVSTHKPKSLLKTVSPQRAQTPSLVSHDAKRLFSPAHLGVTVSEDNALPLKTAFTDLTPRLLAESVFPRDEGSSSRKLREENSEEEIVAPVVFPPPLSDRLLSGAPLCEAGVAGDFPPHLSPPHSPQLKSTAREQPSPHSSESSPQPEKINVEDLTGTDSEPGHIPKLLLDTAVPLPEEAPDGPSTPHPQDLPEDPADAHGQAGDAFPEVPQASGQTARTEEEEDEEQKWQRERKEREERRQREREEAKERELRELQQLEKVSQQEEQLEGEEETKVKKGEDEEQEEESKGENPMEKYMMVLRAEQKQSPVRQESGQTSPEEKSLSEQIESIAACSLKDDEDGFW